MSDKNRDGIPRKLGRGLVQALRGIFGADSLSKIAASADALKSEFEAGRAEAAGESETETNQAEHRELPLRAPDKPSCDSRDGGSDDT